MAKGRHPERENLLLDFVGEASKEQEAVEIVKKKIDDYLSEHSLKKLDSEIEELQNE